MNFRYQNGASRSLSPGNSADEVAAPVSWSYLNIDTGKRQSAPPAGWWIEVNSRGWWFEPLSLITCGWFCGYCPATPDPADAPGEEAEAPPADWQEGGCCRGAPKEEWHQDFFFGLCEVFETARAKFHIGSGLLRQPDYASIFRLYARGGGGATGLRMSYTVWARRGVSAPSARSTVKRCFYGGFAWACRAPTSRPVVPGPRGRTGRTRSGWTWTCPRRTCRWACLALGVKVIQTPLSIFH